MLHGYVLCAAVLTKIGSTIVDWLVNQEGLKNRQAVVTMLSRWLYEESIIPVVKGGEIFFPDASHWYYLKVIINGPLVLVTSLC